MRAFSYILSPTGMRMSSAITTTVAACVAFSTSERESEIAGGARGCVLVCVPWTWAIESVWRRHPLQHGARTVYLCAAVAGGPAGAYGAMLRCIRPVPVAGPCGVQRPTDAFSSIRLWAPVTAGACPVAVTPAAGAYVCGDGGD